MNSDQSALTSAPTACADARQTVLLAGPVGLRHDVPAPDLTVIAVNIGSAAVVAGANTAILTIDATLRAQCQGLAPLFLLQLDERRWVPYTQQSFTGTDALFVALEGPALDGNPAIAAHVAAWAQELSARHRACGPRAVNHQRWFVNALPGQELEHKFTLEGQPDLWGLTTGILDTVRAGGVQGWICEHGNNGGFEQWDFDNHLFEITGPRADRGYIAFIPAVDGTWIIRRKKFLADAAMRHEELIESVQLGHDPDLAAVIADRWGLRPAWGQLYRRVRYNVLLESLASGHVFSIMIDRCTERAGLVDPLHQVEVEYVRSRTLRSANLALLRDEYEELVAFTRKFLADRGVANLEDHWSKLSWLRPGAARQWV
ncbi:hypothetical protein GCM10009745_44310 [Kribbella yunnanensis]|uniref:Uncharacterized protein n=1 Tax=Kribbella yunnanensis TaxID=190194 RepID=A0ABP4TUN2_9ACTN